MLLEILRKCRLPGSTKKVDEVVVKIDFMEELASVINAAQKRASEYLEGNAEVIGCSRTWEGVQLYFRRSEDIFDSRPCVSSEKL